MGKSALSTITIDDQTYTFVCGNRFRGRAVYRGPETYLRIGLPAVVERELTFHRQLLVQGFPVAPLLGTGIHDGQPYFSEAALGDPVFGDCMEAETQAQGAVSEASFRSLLALVLRWGEAQLQNMAPADSHADLATTVRLADVTRLLPAYSVLTRQAFERAQQRLAVFPTVLTHGDFHPYNLCAGGVIDLEFVHWSGAGYDVITGLFAEGLLPPASTDYRYTAQQRRAALAAIDELFHPYHLPRPSAYLDEFRLCRMMRIVQLAEQRPPAVQAWIYERYIVLATTYVNADTHLHAKTSDTLPPSTRV